MTEDQSKKLAWRERTCRDRPRGGDSEEDWRINASGIGFRAGGQMDGVESDLRMGIAGGGEALECRCAALSLQESESSHHFDGDSTSLL